MPHFADDLIEAIEGKQSRICVGIDPNYAKLPTALRDDSKAVEPRRVIDAYYSFVVGVLDAVADVVCCVKFQIAYFERYHHEGLEAYFSLINEAKSKGLLVLGDIKRGDVGTTSEAYAEGHLDPLNQDDVATPNAITVNPMLGLDTITPFADAADRNGKGLFVLVRTSNPGSEKLQDVELKDGRTWSEMLADGLNKIAAPRVGSHGYSNIGAVVGATQPHTMQSIRRRLPNSFFLLPGYGTQGGSAETSRAAFNEDRLGAIVSASRSVLYPQPKAGEDWRQAIARAAREMRDDIENTLQQKS